MLLKELSEDLIEIPTMYCSWIRDTQEQELISKMPQILLSTIKHLHHLKHRSLEELLELTEILVSNLIFIILDMKMKYKKQKKTIKNKKNNKKQKKSPQNNNYFEGFFTYVLSVIFNKIYVEEDVYY